MTGEKKPLKIHLVHQSFGDYVAGLTAGYADLVADGLVELSTTSIASGTASLSEFDASVGQQRRVRLPRFRDPRSFFSALAAVRKIVSQECDVLHWQAAGNPWVDLAFLVLMKPKQTVVTIHDNQAHPGDKSVLPGTFAVIRGIARRAKHVVVHANHVKDQVVAGGVPPDAVSVFAHGELATRYVSKDELPLETTEGNTVLFFGRIQGYKGLDVAVEAVRLLNGSPTGDLLRAVPVTLVVAGRGPSLQDIFPNELSVPSWCQIHQGYVSCEEVVALFERATLVVLPYREASQSGVAALAAGFGKPVVASRVPGLDEMVEHGETGLLVDPGQPDELANAISEVLSDEALRRRLGEGAYRAARGRLSWSSIAADHYRKFLDLRR